MTQCSENGGEKGALFSDYFHKSQCSEIGTKAKIITSTFREGDRILLLQDETNSVISPFFRINTNLCAFPFKSRPEDEAHVTPGVMNESQAVTVMDS